ncbi:hypothetical protein I308_104807 [Cryptococcus tetragattii IND107]|uniref:Uncharacterized protein n=1 Tax=Cryptococcus tetragattii IND107 TaxID=1296105 RepID=A0ABR3BNM6_9TREE
MRIREISLKEAKDDEDDERQLDRLASSGTSDVSGLTFLQSSSNFGSEYHFQVSSTSSPPTSTILTAREDDETLRSEKQTGREEVDDPGSCRSIHV